ncbi:MAG: response regulator [Phycisphaeraceae bacterium]|nr:response regulator [Phycisphaeraceae bacterium]
MNRQSEHPSENGRPVRPGIDRPRLFVLDTAEPGEQALLCLRGQFDVSVLPLNEFRAADFDLALVPASIRASDLTGLTIGARAVLDSLGEGACLCDTEGSLVWCTGRFDLFDQPTREKIIVACREAASRYGAMFAEMVEYDRTRPIPTRKIVVTSDESSRVFEVIISAVLDAELALQGRAVLRRVAAVVFDITAARRASQKTQTIERAAEELVRIEPDTVRKMHVAERLNLLRQRIVTLAHELLQFDHFAIWLVEPDTKRLELVMSTGLSPEVQTIDLYAMPENNGISGYVGATGRSYICHDVAKDPRYIKGMDTPGSSLTLPLLLNDKVIGVFNIESNRIGAFSEDDRHFAENFARYVALALNMLNLMVAERIATSATVSERVEGSISEPLNDLMIEVDWLREQAAVADPKIAVHVARITKDIEAIRSRVKQAASGASTILGIDRELERKDHDPLIAGRTILLADDDPVIRDLARSVLLHRGAVVRECENGKEALKILRTPEGEPLAVSPVDLIVSDIRMPDHNGYEIFAAAQRIPNPPPVILMTGFGYDPHHSIVRASQEGLQCVLFKPFQIDQLIAEVHKAFSAP